MKFFLITRQRIALLTLLSLAGTSWPLVDLLYPPAAQATVNTASITPTWNTVAIQQQEDQSCVVQTDYMCEVGSNQTLYTYSENAPGCDDAAESARIALAFDLSSIPASAMITKVELSVHVKFATSATQSVYRMTTDAPDTLNCGNGNLFSATGGALYGTFTNWGSNGAKVLDLGSQAVTDIQQRLTTSHQAGLSIISNSDFYGAIHAFETPTASSRPALKVTYSTMPDAPTNFSLTSRTTNSLTWSWIENGWAETHNYVRDDSQADRCDAGPVGGLANPVSCAESGLLPNTLYSRHPTAVDPEGATNGQGASASTAIETPTGVAITGVTASSISLAATGTISHLTRTFSGLFFQDTSTGQASGWSQTNGWTLTGLTPNTPHTFYGRARNGDGVETPSAVSQQVYTLAATASAASDRLINAWYATPTFSFYNTAGWGAGGVAYYQYAWNGSATYAFTGSEAIWNPSPGLALQASHAVPMYLHLRPFNGDSVPNGSVTYGPYVYDGAEPLSPTSAELSSQGNSAYTKNLAELSAAWTLGQDDVSGIHEYQFALGSTSGGTEVRGFTSTGFSTSASLTGLNLQNGTQYYLSVRTVDVAGNISSSTISRPILANTAKPQIIDRQLGDLKHRRTAGTKYNVDFRQAPTGPALQSAQYSVYSKTKNGGRRIINWTNIFNQPKNSFTDDWTVNFNALPEGTNYVSVRATGLDGLVATQTDAFTIIKDMSPAPSIKGLYQATFPVRQSSVNLLIVGRGFKPGATVYVGTARANKVILNKYGQLQASVPMNRLRLGRFTLRVVNPNGLEASRPNKVFITAG